MTGIYTKADREALSEVYAKDAADYVRSAIKLARIGRDGCARDFIEFAAHDLAEAFRHDRHANHYAQEAV